MPEWRWRGRDRITDEVTEFFTRGPQLTEAELKDHVEEHYRGLHFIDAWPSDKPPLVAGACQSPALRTRDIRLGSSCCGSQAPRADRSGISKNYTVR